MGKRLLSAMIGFAALCSACPANATTDSALVVTHVGIQGSQIYVTFSVPPSAGCLGDLLYLSTSTVNSDMIMSVLLTARVTGERLNRVDYTKYANMNGQCFIDLIEI